MCQKKEEPQRYVVEIQQRNAKNQTKWSRMEFGFGWFRDLDDARGCAAYQNKQPGQRARIWDNVEKRVVT